MSGANLNETEENERRRHLCLHGLSHYCDGYFRERCPFTHSTQHSKSCAASPQSDHVEEASIMREEKQTATHDGQGAHGRARYAEPRANEERILRVLRYVWGDLFRTWR